VSDAFMQVEIRQRIAGFGGADLVREAEGPGLLVGLVAVEQQARAEAVGRLPEILGGVLDLGIDDVGDPLAPGSGQGAGRPGAAGVRGGWRPPGRPSDRRSALSAWS
jgi:hypothetical protein